MASSAEPGPTMVPSAEPGPTVDEPLLFDPPPTQRRFSPGDGLRLILAVGLLIVGLVSATVAEETIGGAEADLVEGFSRLSDRAEQFLIGSAQLIATLVPLGALVIVVWKRAWRLLLSLWLAGQVASVVSILVERALGDREASIVLAERTIGTSWLADPNFPTSSYLASAAATVTVGAPWLSRSWKRAVWTWVAVLVLLRILGPGEPAFDVMLAVAIGVVVGSVVLFVLGSPNPEPRPRELWRALRAAGLEPNAILRSPTAPDLPRFVVRQPDVPDRFVKVRTPDDRSSDLLNRLYRAVRLRSSEVDRPYSTLKRRVEHEALLLREARRAGVRCPELLTVGTTDGGSVFLVLELVEGTAAAEHDPDTLGDELLDDLWTQVRLLHEARISHRSLGLGNVMVDPDRRRVSILDMDEAELASSPRDRARDVAELLVDLSLIVGIDRTVGSAVRTLGDEAVAAALPLLQPLALSRAVRRRLRSGSLALDELRSEVQARTGAPDIRLDRLERVSPRTLVMIVAGSLAFYSLLPQFANFGDTVDAFGDARLEWIPALLLASAFSYVFATISFLGSVAQPVPVAASGRLTVASSFAGLVGPATTGSMALAVRFLQRAGVDTTDASASVGLNSIAGVVTHLVLMFSFFAWTGSSGVGGFSLPDANTITLILAGLVAIVAVAMVIGPIRRLVLRPVVEVLGQAVGYLGTVFRSPLRVLALLGGSSFITLSYVVALICAVEAFGGGISVPQIGAAYLGAAAIANVAPTPGGLGALEAAMVAALTGFGLDDGVAVSSVLTFRLATFWLPVLPGWATFLWMQRREEI